ncbi:MAG TPA: V-type ATP synthase subunit E family protein [Sedimentisphaerales bacterium]|nr:V-type ATP synthase subunit E family protein [Sedimentisphaerales bacterium]HRS09816.1 V-type ATP synthase subunit E family protein [Sedimentisphaerales bacterium]HRV46534.1 V-type ATP synthase subunit E family protein [Sedimentisphaerales bacterium]
MQAEQVIEKILSDARAQAATIAKEAADKAAAERAALDAQLADYRQQTEALVVKAAEDEKAHILAQARMEAAKAYLAEKAAILDEVFARAKQRLAELPDHEYRELMARLMVEAVETGDEEVVVGAHEHRIDQNLINDVNGRLVGQGKKGNLRLAAERHHLAGGFVLRRGKIKTNVSLDPLIDQARTALEIELAKDLFA